MASFTELREAKRVGGRFLCVGLDPQPEKHPTVSVLSYLIKVVEATIDVAGCYKPNLAFFEGLGHNGLWQLAALIAHIKHLDPAMPVIGDGKQGDIGDTNEFYAEAVFSVLGADALTVNPYLGLGKAAEVFLAHEGKMAIVLCRTTNEGAREFQDVLVDVSADPINGRGSVPLYQLVARNVSRDWSQKGSVGLVAAATYPDDIAAIREIAPTIFLLIPGIGKQLGDLENSVRYALGPDGSSDFVLNVSTAVVYAFEKGSFQCDLAEFANAAEAAAEDYDRQIREIVRGLQAA